MTPSGASGVSSAARAAASKQVNGTLGPETLTLDVIELLRRGVLAPGTRTRGVVSWFGADGATVASVCYEADMVDSDRSWLRLRFSTPAPGGARRQSDQRVALTATRPGFGGARWWFVDDGGRRVGRLHLTPGGERFGSLRAQSSLAAYL